MKAWTRIAIIAAVVVVGIVIFALFGRVAPPPQVQRTGPSGGPLNPAEVPAMVTGTIPASSYGAGSVGSKNATSVTLTAPVSSTQLGILTGQAKPQPGTSAHPNYTSIQVTLTDPKTDKLLASQTLASDGSYKFIVESGEYVLNTVPAGLSSALPQRMLIGAGQVINLNFFVK